MNYFLVSIGAIFGAIFRFFISLKLNSNADFLNYGTLFVNLIGSFLVGSIFSALLENGQNFKLFFITGFLGAFTTFSAFSLEILLMLQQGLYKNAIFCVILHTFGAIFMCGLGFYLAKFLR